MLKAARKRRAPISFDEMKLTKNCFNLRVCECN